MAPSAFVTLCLLALASAAPNPENVAKMDALMPEICTLSQGQSDIKVASLVAQGIELLRYTPDDAVVGILDKVRAGTYCAEYTKLESLFLDAVAFVGTRGAYNVMEQELASGSTTGGRLILYTVAMAPLSPVFEEYKKVATNQGAELIQAVQDIINNNNINIDTIVAELKKLILLIQNTIKDGNINTDTVVAELNKYIQLIQDTIKEKNINVETIVVELQKLIPIVQATLKENGIDTNTIIVELQRIIRLSQDVLKNKGIDTDIMIVRLTSLVDLVLNTIKDSGINMNTISTELQKIIQLVLDTVKDKEFSIETIVQEFNKFIQLVQNTIKEKNINVETIVFEVKKLYKLVLTAINEKDISIATVVAELNKFIPVIQATLKDNGIDVNTIIGELQKFIQPLQETLKNKGIDTDIMIVRIKSLIQLVINTIKESDININTITVELQKVLQLIQDTIKDKEFNIDTISQELSKVIQLALNTIKDKDISIDTIVVEVNKLYQLVLKTIKENNINIDTVVAELQKLIPIVKVTLKENGIDVDTIVGELNLLFKSIMDLIKDKSVNIDIIIAQLRTFIQPVLDVTNETIIPAISNAINVARDFNIDTARTGQINVDLLIPTFIGLPIKIKLTGTAVVGVKMINNLNLNDAFLKVIPSLNGHFEAQLGLGEKLYTGLKFEESVFTTNGFSLSISQKNGKDLELQIELPERMELFGIQSAVTVMNSGNPVSEVQLLSGELQDVRIVSNQCISLVEPVTGLLVCYDINVPNVISSNSVPLGKPNNLRVYLQKSDAAMNGYSLSAKFRNKPEKKLLKFVAGTYGSAASKQSAFELSYTIGGDTQSVALGIQSTLITSTTEMILISQPEYYSLQIQVNNKLLTLAPVVGKLRLDFKPLTVDNGKTYQVETYFGLSKSLNEKHRLFKSALSLLDNGDMNTANFITKSDFLPATFEVEIDLPKNAGILVYKVNKITVRTTVLSAVVEGIIAKKSPGVFQTEFHLLNSGSMLVNIDTVYTVAIDSPYIGGAANKLNLVASVNGKILSAEFGYVAKFNYENGVFVCADSIEYFGSEVAAVTSQLAFENGAIIFTNGVRYFGAEALTAKSQLTYATESLAVSSSFKYYDSELLAKSKLSFVNGVIELTDELSYLGSTVAASSIQLTLDLNNLAFMSKIDVPLFKSGFLSKLSYSNFAITSSNVALYSGSEVVNADARLAYVNGNIIETYKITSEFFSRELLFANFEYPALLKFPYIVKFDITIPDIFSLKYQDSLDVTGFSAQAQVEIPGVIAPLTIEEKIEIISVFSYNFLTDVTSGDSTLLHIEGPLAFTFSRQLVQENLDLKITGAFEGAFKVLHVVTISLEKIEYIVDMRKSEASILEINLSLDRSSGKEITSKSVVKLPFVVESEIITTITMSLVHAHVNILALPGTPYARRFKGSTDFNWVENNFKADLYWDAENDTDKKVELTTKYALDTAALKFVIQGDLSVTTFKFGYNVEGFVASPLGWFQGTSGTEIKITLPSAKIAVAKSVIDIQYSASELVVKPVVAFITTNENKYELATSVVMTKLPVFLTFAITSETTLSTPQLGQVTLATSLLHEDKEESGKIAFQVTLKESVLSEELSVEYVLKSEASDLLSIVRVMKGSNVASLSTQIHLVSGVQVFEITNELSLPVIALATKLSKTAEGSVALALLKNQAPLITVYYTMPVLTSHTVGIEIPSRKVEFNTVFARNQITFQVLPEANKSPDACELALRMNLGAAKGQLEALVTSPKLSKELRLAVELELIENGGDKYDLVSLDVQYQVSEAPKLLTGTLEELKNVYLDLVNDGLSPDLNQWYRQVQKLVKQAPKYLNSLKNRITKLAPKYYENVKTYVLNIYQLYEPDVIAIWNTARTELLGYLNIVKTQAPVLFNKYIEILKNTETWKAVEVLLNELLVNYPVYYNAAIDFYNNVIIPYFTQLTEMLGEVLVLPDSDVYKIIATIRAQVTAIVQKVGPQVLKSKAVKLVQKRAVELLTLTQEKIAELKALYPTEFSLLEDFYSNVILPTSSDVLAVVNKVLAVPDFDYAKYFNIMITEVPALFNALSQRILSTQIVGQLRTAFPVLFVVVEDIYSSIILPTVNDIVALLQKVVALPVDFEQYLEVSKVEVPVIAGQFVQRVLDSQLLKELKTYFPTLVEIFEDLYTTVLIPSIEDLTVLVGKVIALPIVDLQETATQYWAFIKAELPPVLATFFERLTGTKLVQKLRTQFPIVFDLTQDVYTTVIVPTATDIAAVVEMLVNIPLSDIKVAAQQIFDILKVELPKLSGQLLERVSGTQIYVLVKEQSTVLLQLVLGKLEELKAQYPDAVALILDLYNQVAVPAYSELVVIYGKLVQVTDIYQLCDVLITEVVVFIQNLQKNLNNTTIMKVALARLSELLAILSELLTQLQELLAPLPEYQALLEVYNQISQITVNDVVTRLNDIVSRFRSYIVGELGFSLTVTAEKLTAVFPLFVSVEDVRSSYYFLTVTAPAYALDQLTELSAKWLPQARLLYKYIEENTALIIDSIFTAAPVYLQIIRDYLETLKVIIPQYVEQIKAELPKYAGELQNFLLPYLQQLQTTVVTYYEFARDSTYGKLIQQKAIEIYQILLTSVRYLQDQYPVEYSAIMDSLSLYFNICFEYAAWALNAIVEYPPVMKAIQYIINLTPEDLLQFLELLKGMAISTMGQIEARVNVLIASLPKELPVFFKLHIPAFFITVITSIVSYLI